MIEIGDVVYWNDPEGLTSDEFVIFHIEGGIEQEDCILHLKNDYSETQAYKHEITKLEFINANNIH